MPKEKIRDPTVLVVHMGDGYIDYATDSRKEAVLEELASLDKTHVCLHTPPNGYIDPNGWDPNRRYWVCGIYFADSHEKEPYGDACVDFQTWWFKHAGLDAEVYLPATILAESHRDHVPIEDPNQ